MIYIKSKNYKKDNKDKVSILRFLLHNNTKQKKRNGEAGEK